MPGATPRAGARASVLGRTAATIDRRADRPGGLGARAVGRVTGRGREGDSHDPAGSVAIRRRAAARGRRTTAVRRRARSPVRRSATRRWPAAVRRWAATVPRRSVAVRRTRTAGAIRWFERARRTPTTRVWLPILVAGRPGWRVVRAVRRTPVGASIGSPTRDRGGLPRPATRPGRTRSLAGRSPRTAVPAPAIWPGSRTGSVRDRTIEGAGGSGRIGAAGTPRRRAAGLALGLAARLR